MISINYKGRLGNQIIQYVAACILSQKHNLEVISDPVCIYDNINNLKTDTINSDKAVLDFGSFFNMPKMNGRRIENQVEVQDWHYHHYLHSNHTDCGFVLNGYFQHPDLFIDHRKQILKLFNLQYSNEHKNDVLVVHRAFNEDFIVKNRGRMPVDYYTKHLNSLNFNQGYITSDDMNCHEVKTLIKNFNLEPYNCPPLEKLDFAKNFGNLIVGDGTYCYLMAYLSQAKNIIHPNQLHWLGRSSCSLVHESQLKMYEFPKRHP